MADPITVDRTQMPIHAIEDPDSTLPRVLTRIKASFLDRFRNESWEDGGDLLWSSRQCFLCSSGIVHSLQLYEPQHAFQASRCIRRHRTSKFVPLLFFLLSHLIVFLPLCFHFHSFPSHLSSFRIVSFHLILSSLYALIPLTSSILGVLAFSLPLTHLDFTHFQYSAVRWWDCFAFRCFLQSSFFSGAFHVWWWACTFYSFSRCF